MDLLLKSENMYLLSYTKKIRMLFVKKQQTVNFVTNIPDGKTMPYYACHEIKLSARWLGQAARVASWQFAILKLHPHSSGDKTE